MRGERSEGRHFRLRVVEGPLEGATYRLGDSFVLGRSAACDLALLDPGVSRLHARVTLTHAGEHVVCDLGSVNGTMVNREPIRERTLAADDEISICSVRFVYERIPTDAQSTQDSGRVLLDQGTFLPERGYEGDPLSRSGPTQRRAAELSLVGRRRARGVTSECGGDETARARDVGSRGVPRGRLRAQ